MPSTLGIVASGEDVFNDAVLWLDTARSVANETTMVNYGKGGSALNATYGSSAGADTNDPLLLTHTGTNYLYLPGANNNYANLADSAGLDVTGDIEIVMRVGLSSWTPASALALASRDAGDPNRSWHLRLETTGRFGLRWFPTGSAASSIIVLANATPPFAAGTTYWLKATLDVDNGASGNTCRFYYAADQATEPSSWTQIGTDVVTAGVTSLPNVTSVLSVGSTPTGVSTGDAGNYYRLIVRNGIGGSTVADIDFTTGITSGGQASFTAGTGGTVTIFRATSGRKSVAVVRNVLLFGTDDYLEIADSDLLDFGAAEPFTLMAVHRQWATFVGSGSILMKKSATGASGVGWDLRSGGGTPAQVIFDGYDGSTVAVPASPSRTAGVLSVVTGLASATQFTTYLGNSAGTPATRPSGSLANSEAVRVGRLSGSGTQYNDMELVAVAVWRRALTTNEIATAVARYA